MCTGKGDDCSENLLKFHVKLIAIPRETRLRPAVEKNKKKYVFSEAAAKPGCLQERFSVNFSDFQQKILPDEKVNMFLTG